MRLSKLESAREIILCFGMKNFPISPRAAIDYDEGQM